ncbi:uncharacterized protein N7458_005127 [Penicillium daleae]|uniref:Uncharacterized protein n=1 Tax=Penicillium daleae TaxID=63821 RepID=A0AAD6C7E8_9EURO|nr:uncharacterized protein N7458_005127 [Penicillium daleae]KAJ5454171.1 hypothetical protein N7458_005127 [Penicillium daleae]
MFLVLLPSQALAAVMAQVGWSESYDELVKDMNRLLVGSNGEINVVIIIKWTRCKYPHVSGVVELYRKNNQTGMPELQQSETIFPLQAVTTPQRLEIRRGDLFGTALQSGRNPNDVLYLDIDKLRYMAKDILRCYGAVTC